jgi:hypothetical protein
MGASVDFIDPSNFIYYQKDLLMLKLGRLIEKGDYGLIKGLFPIFRSFISQPERPEFNKICPA